MDAVDLAFAGAVRQAAHDPRPRDLGARADRALPRADRAARPAAQRLPRRARRARAGRGRPGRRARQGGRHAAAARRPVRDQGRHGRGRRADRLRQRRPRRPGGGRRRGGAAPALGRGGDPRQDARARAHDHAVDGVADLRGDAQPMGPPAHAGRLVRRLRHRDGRRACAGATIGSDGAGSIRIPAACCGLFGLKPQNGRVPTAPAVEPWHGMSIWGPLTRGVADSALDLRRDQGRRAVVRRGRRAHTGPAEDRRLPQDAAADRRAGRRRAAQRRRARSPRRCAGSGTR